LADASVSLRVETRRLNGLKHRAILERENPLELRPNTVDTKSVNNYSDTKITVILNSKRLGCGEARAKALELLQGNNEFKRVNFVFEDLNGDHTCSEHNPVRITDCGTGQEVNAPMYIIPVTTFIDEKQAEIWAACKCSDAV